MSKDFAAERRLMGALVRMPPKPHDEMKLSKAKPKLKKSLPDGKKGEARELNFRGPPVATVEITKAPVHLGAVHSGP